MLKAFMWLVPLILLGAWLSRVDNPNSTANPTVSSSPSLGISSPPVKTKTQKEADFIRDIKRGVSPALSSAVDDNQVELIKLGHAMCTYKEDERQVEGEEYVNKLSLPMSEQSYLKRVIVPLVVTSANSNLCS